MSEKLHTLRNIGKRVIEISGKQFLPGVTASGFTTDDANKLLRLFPEEVVIPANEVQSLRSAPDAISSPAKKAPAIKTVENTEPVEVEESEGSDDEADEEVEAVTYESLMKLKKPEQLAKATELGVEGVSDDNNKDEIATKILAHIEATQGQQAA